MKGTYGGAALLAGFGFACALSITKSVLIVTRFLYFWMNVLLSVGDRVIHPKSKRN